MDNSQNEFTGDLCLTDIPELVIDEIFKYLEEKSLLNCRLAWKGWEKRIKSLIEKNNTLFLNFTKDRIPRNDEIIENFVRNPNILLPPGLLLSAINLKTISQLTGLSQFHKFRNLQWSSWRPYGNPREILADDFFSILGILSPTLETFDCFTPHIASMTADQYNKISGTLSLPNLRKLYLPCHGKIENYSAHCWQRLVISAAPNLNFVEESSILFKNRFKLDIIKILNETGRLSKLKGMSLVRLTEEQLEILLQSGIQLEEFNTKFIAENSFTAKLQNFLHKQKGSLKKLYLSSEPGERPHMPIVFPTMMNLTHLSLGFWHLFKQLKFAQDLSKLKELEVLESENPGSWIEMLDSPFNALNPCKTLRTLKLDMERRPIVFENCCDLLGELFPCVSSLHLRWPTEGFLKGVWRNWPNLKELCLESVSQEDDTGIIPCLLDNVLFRIPEDWENSVDISGEEWWTRVNPLESDIPTLLNLKCLKKCTIRDSASKMTKFSVYLGFAKMKNLRRLEMEYTECERFTTSEADLNFLRQTIPGLIVTQTNWPTRNTFSTQSFYLLDYFLIDTEYL